MKNIKKVLILFSLVLLLVSTVLAQKDSSTKKSVSMKTIFAVVNDGKQIEPIAYIESGKLKAIDGDDISEDIKKGFIGKHYKAKTRYNLIFGGKNVGTATVVKDLADTDCAGNQAVVTVSSKRVKPKGFLIPLATDATPKKNVKGTRELPTSAERAEIEKLVMSEMKSKNVPIKNTGELRYHNLTKIDVNSDGSPEFVGTFWYNTGAKKRSLLFFIAEKDEKGKISISLTQFNEIEEENVMSGEIKSVDDGIYHELLLDIFDYDGDGAGEIFTMSQAFEGSNFNVYKRVDGKWTRTLETSNYHCGY